MEMKKDWTLGLLCNIINKKFNLIKEFSSIVFFKWKLYKEFLTFYNVTNQ